MEKMVKMVYLAHLAKLEYLVLLEQMDLKVHKGFKVKTDDLVNVVILVCQVQRDSPVLLVVLERLVSAGRMEAKEKMGYPVIKGIEEQMDLEEFKVRVG